MKTLLQLLKEFWLPLLVALAWTGYNLFSMPVGKQNIREFINLLGPTFFFLSWLVAQWFRVRKQHRIDEGLSSIEQKVETIGAVLNGPLLPVGLFYTLRHTTTPEVIAKAFQSAEGYEMTKSEFLQPVGFTQLGGLGTYNMIEMRPTRSCCTLQNDALAALIQSFSGFGESAIKSPTKTTLEFYFQGKKSIPNTPSLVLKLAYQGGRPTGVKTLRLFDDVIFQDVAVRGWEIINSSETGWSVSDLRKARILLRMEFSSYSDVNIEHPPRLHNLHLYFGEGAQHLLCFSAQQLENPTVVENTSPEIRWDFSAVPELSFKPLLMTYDFEVTDELFSNQIKHVI